MKFHLKDLINYRDIVVQCHDNPDADALASGFALVWYLKKQDIDARFVYGGKEAVQKSNLLKMIDDLQITVEHITELPEPELLVTVDCQYGESNVTKFDAEKVIVIDHHRVSGELPDPSDVRSNYGSCSTVLYELLTAEGLDINENKRLATALYYGLMTDTDNFSSIFHPADRDLRDMAKYDESNISGFRSSNLSKEELGIAGRALQNAIYDDTYRYGVIETDPCDSNILGLVSDMLLEVDGVDTCVVYDLLDAGVKISVRSGTITTKASELAKYLAEDMGGGGGHLTKAGGFLKKDLIEKKAPAIIEMMHIPTSPDKKIDAEYFIKRFEEPVRIANERGTALYCGEYGVIDVAKPGDVLEWYKTINAAFEHYGIGRATWSYKEMNFGLTRSSLDGVRSELLKYI